MRSRGKLHRFDDVLIAGAAAQIAGQRLADLRFVRRRRLVEKRLHGHQDAGRAVAALQAVAIAHRLLQRMQMFAVGREPLDGRDRVAVGLRREHQAGAHGSAVEDHRAGAADAVLAADMRAGEQQIVAQEIAEQQPRLDAAPVRRAVHRDGDVVRVGIGASVRTLRPLVRRRQGALRSGRRRYGAGYSLLAWMLPPGSIALWTSAAAASIAARRSCGRQATGSPSRRRPVRRRHCTGRSAPATQRPLGIELHRASDADDGEIAAPARDFHEAAAGSRRRDRQFHFHQHLVGLERGGQRADEKIRRGDPSLAVRRLRAQPAGQRQHDGRHFGRRIGMREIAADGAAIADLRMRDMRQRLVRRAAGLRAWSGSRSRLAVAGQRTDRGPFAGRVLAPRRTSISGLMSISIAGWVSRKFIVGTRLWPPARKRASSPCSALNARACSRRAGGDVLERRGFHVAQRLSEMAGAGCAQSMERLRR